VKYILIIFFVFLFSFNVISCSSKDSGSSSTSTDSDGTTTDSCLSTSISSRQLARSSNDYAYGVATDSSGNVYVAGGTNGGLDGNTNAGNTDLFVVKYNSSGTKQWTRQLGSSSDSSQSDTLQVKSPILVNFTSKSERNILISNNHGYRLNC